MRSRLDPMTQLIQKMPTPASIVHQFERNATLPIRTDALWLIHRGAVKTVTFTEDGDSITLGYWGPGEVAGKPLSHVNPYEIECLTYVEASCVPLSNWPWLNEAICRHAQQTEELLYLVRLEPMHQRLHNILLWIAQKFSRTIPQGQLIDLRLTHQDLAEITGTTRVTITRLLSQLERQGVLRRTAARTIILLKSEPPANLPLKVSKIKFC